MIMCERCRKTYTNNHGNVFYCKECTEFFKRYLKIEKVDTSPKIDRPISIAYNCACCGGFAYGPADCLSIDTGCTFTCETCDGKTVVQLMTVDEYVSQHKKESEDQVQGISDKDIPSLTPKVSCKSCGKTIAISIDQSLIPSLDVFCCECWKTDYKKNHETEL